MAIPSHSYTKVIQVLKAGCLSYNCLKLLLELAQRKMKYVESNTSTILYMTLSKQ